MFINKKEKFSIRKFKDGRSDSVKIGTVGLIVGAALAMAGQPHIAEAAMTENSDNTTTISNDKGSVIVDTANIENPDAGRQFSTDPTAEGTNTIIKTGKVDYKYVTAEGNTVLEENKNQNSGADKTIETPYDVYGKSGEVFKGTTGGDAEASDLNDAKENGKKETIEKDGKTYHLIGEPKVETTGNGGGVYSDTTLGDVTAKLTPEGLSNAEGKITYDTVKPGGKAWIVEQTGKGTYGKYVQADSGAITSDAKMIEAFKAGEATAKNFTSANVTADGGIKEGDYVFVLEKNTYVTAKTESFSLTAQIQLSSSDNVADDKDGTGATLNRTYAMVQNFKAAPDTLTGEANKTLVKNYLAYLQEKGFEDNLLNFKRYITLGMAAKTGGPLEISADKGDQVDDKGRPTSDITADIASVTDQETSTLEDSSDFLLKFSDPSPEVEEYSYRDEITPLRAYRLASGTTTITYTYAEEKTREIEKKGSVVVNYQTEDGTELKAPYTDTPETVVEVVTEHYYVNADGEEVVVEDKTVRTPKNVAYNTKENETEKPQKLTDAQGNVYYLNEANTTTSVNDTETTSPAEEGTLVEGVTKVTYIYEKAGSVIVNYKTEDGTPLIGTVVDEDGAGKTVESGAKDTDNGKPGTAYNTADNGMKPTRIKTAEGKVYELIPESTEGEPEGEVESGVTKEVTYIYKEVKGNVVVKYEDTEGNSLADDEQDETDASLNVKYDTTDHKKESIEKDGVKYYLTTKELKDGYKETGDVVEGTTEVTYVYEKAGSVIVNYQTEYGTPLVGTADGANVESGAKDTTDAKAGTDYNTADNGMKPNRITTAEGKVYELVPTATKGDETGKVVAGETKEVTYVYKEVKGNVIVKFQDTEGNPIADDENDETNASLNTNYNTSEHKKATIVKDGVTYYLTDKALKDGSKPEEGPVVEGTTEVTYVYEKAGSVIVNYQTEDGTPLVGTADGKDIASGAKDTTDAKAGTDYNTADNGMKPNRITTAEGKVYELVPTATKGDETGKVVAGETKEVTYVYKEVTGDVVVHYVDTEGNVIADDKEDTKGASLNAKYDTTDNKPEKIEKDGTVYYLTAKALKDDSKPENGDVVEGKTEVTYVYEKAGSVIVNYQTEDGTPLVGTADGANVESGVKDTTDAKAGTDYNTADNGMKPNRITTAEGKVYELVPTATKGDETGKVVAGETKEVTYVYKEVKGNVVVKYEDTEGNPLAADEQDETDASLNVKYDTADHKKDEIIKDGVKYYLTAKELKDDSKPATGDVVEGTTTVTYVYEKAGSVIVNYQTEDGTPLMGTADGANVESGAKDTTDAKAGTDYNTADNGMKPNRITTAEGKVYELVPTATKGDETGKVVAGETKEVTYVYKEVTGDVVVHYVDTEGNVIAEDKEEAKGASLNAKYDTTDNKPATIEKDGVKYYLTEKAVKDDSKPETGDVVEGKTEVTYVYEKAGQVVVHYVDEAGNTIQTDAVDTKDGKPGAAYNTTDNDMKPTRITTPEGKVYELVPASTKGNETGDVEAGKTTEVTYVYKEVKGNVVVHYVDEAGNTIAEDVKDTTDGSVSSAYDTTDNKLVTITTKDGKKYALVPTATKGSENGKVTEETVEVTYVYKEVTGDVVVHYVDTEGNVIAEDKEDTKGASLNAKYDTTDNKPEKIEKDGTVYYLTEKALKDDSKPENGDVVEGKTEVTYVYEKAGQVVVHYTDEKGNTIQADAVDTKDGKPNADYNTADNDMKPNRITTAEGKVYELVPESTKGDETGKVVAGEMKEVTYVYKEVTGDVVVHYVDTEGNVIAEDKEDTKGASLNAKYDTTDNKPEKIEKDGTVYYLTEKALKDDSKPENGDVVEGKTEVTYVYEKAGQVVVHYTDEKGNTIQVSAVATKDSKPGAAYNTTDKDLKPTRITNPEGKVYELVPASTKGNENGSVEAGKTTEVTYVYKEVKGNVVVHYTDEAGNTIAEDVKDTTDGSVSSAYDTTDNKPAVITTKDGKKYALVPTATKGTENGKVTEGTTEVTYVYKEVTGDVVVHYVDTEGNVIAEDKEEAKGASLNAKYDTTDNKPATIEKDGVKYYLTEKAVKDDSKPETGDVVEGKTEVTYVYEKAGQVVVHYVDEAGNTIQTDAVDTKDGKPGAAYNTTDNDMKPTRITTPEGKVYELVPASTKGNETGDVEAGKTTEVTYVYKEVKGNVVVHYVDEAGNTIAEDVKDTTDGSVSSAYDTTDNKLVTITTKDGKKYALVPTATKGSENGKVTEGTTEVTYVYKEVKEDSTNGGSPTPSQPGSQARPSTNPTSPVKPTDPSQPETPVVPTDPSQPTTPANPANPAGPVTPTMPSAPENGEAPQAPAASSEAKGQAELPNTGTEDNASLAALGLLGVLSGFGLVARKKKED